MHQPYKPLAIECLGQQDRVYFLAFNFTGRMAADMSSALRADVRLAPDRESRDVPMTDGSTATQTVSMPGATIW